MRKTVYKSRALTAAVLICAAALIVAIYPLRLFRRTVERPSGTQAGVTTAPQVNSISGVRQYFTAEYDRLDAIDLYVRSLDGGRYLWLVILDETMVARGERLIDLYGETFPGYVRIPLGIDLEIGGEYSVSIRNLNSSFTLEIEQDDGYSAPYMGMLYHQTRDIWDGMVGYRLRWNLRFSPPWSRNVSLFAMATVAAVAALLVFALKKWYGAHPEKDRLILPAIPIRKCVTALLALVYLTIFFFNFPMRKFGQNAIDVLFYAVGIALSAVCSFYALRRVFDDREKEYGMNAAEWLTSILIAFALRFACDYMNGVYEAMHDTAQRRMLLCLSGAWALLCFQNAKSRVGERSEETSGHIARRFARAISPLGYVTLVFFAAMIAFRNTRAWIPMMGATAALLYGAAYGACRRGRWYLICANGVGLHFVFSMFYCLLYRAYQAFYLTRYGFVFHTATVTGEYLSMMCGCAAAMLLQALIGSNRELSLRDAVRRAWKEILFFATVCAYAIFTLSRLAYVTIAATLLFLLLLVAIRRPARAFRGVAVMALSVALVFPAAFTMQRVLPAINGRHQMLKGPEEGSTVAFILGRASWDSGYYISIRQFESEFRARILGLPKRDLHFILDPENHYPDGSDKYDLNGEPFAEGESVIVENARYQAAMEARQETERQDAQTEETAEEPTEEAREETPAPDDETQVAEETTENEDAQEPPPDDVMQEVTNGRREIWRAYLDELNMTGHDEMFNDNTVAMHAHNAYLQVAFDCGIPVGVLFLLWIGITIGTGAIRYVGRDRSAGERAQSLLAAGSAVAFAIIGVGEWSFHLCNPVTLIFLLAIAPLMYRAETTETASKE